MGKRLMAYVVPRQGRSVSAEALRQFLATRLPEHMIPAVWIELAALPRTPGGKVDRAALAAAATAAAAAAAASAASAGTAAATARPLTPDEALIAGVFAEVLGLAHAGPDLDFFASGGHSLLAMRVVARVRALAGVELPVRAVFEAPTPAKLALRLGEHAAHRPPEIERIGRDRPLRASFAQERLWLLQRVEPDANYNLPAAVHLDGDLDVAALEVALGGVIARHEVLRTRLVTDDGIPFQVIEPARPLALPVEDLGDLPEDARLPAALARATADATRGFDLAGFPLWRARLLRLAPRRHVLVLVLHHLLADGWSIAVLIRELGALYRAARAGQPGRLPDLPVQYADYAAWQRGWLDGPRRDALLDYWRGALAGAPPLLALPTDRPRPRAQRFAGARLRCELPEGLGARLRGLAQREGATLFMTLLAGFGVLLARRAGQRDLVIGTDVANRDVPAIEPLIGFFVNQLALRVQIEEGASFRAVLRRVANTALDAYAHQALPFELLVKHVNPSRTTSHAPIFQVKMALQDGGPPLSLEGLAVRVQELETQSAKLDLTLTWDDEGGRLTGIWEYNADLFDARTIASFARELERVLDEAAADPDRDASALGAAVALTAPALWAAAVARTPAALAVAGGDTRLSYGEVDARAKQLAHHLIARGVGRGALIGVLLPRSPELIVALLAAWKAGAAWVPLDAALPDHRLRVIVEDARPALVVTTLAEAGRLAPGTGVVVLDAEDGALAAEPDQSPARAPGPDDLAYVMYTSGSTGTPKGVMIDHRGLAGYLAWSAAAYDAGAGTGSPVHTSIGFDLTVTSLFTPLVQGRPVWLLPDERDPFALLSFLRAHRDLTLLKLTPAHLALLGRQLAAASEAAPPPDAVRVLVVGGEALLPEHVDAWQRHLPGARLVNEYGPTEAVVGCAIYDVPPAPAAGALPIGAPIPAARLYVLDEAGERCPRDAAGELYIGGAHLAQGYLGRRGLTAERFLPDPFAPEPGARMYRSGDRARWSADGTLEFLGRVDEQIKLNGFRIEPAEIEARLRAHPSVAEAVAIARTDEAGDRRLVAYVVPRPGAAPSARALRAFCRDELPEYMVPAAVVTLPALPLTHNGKVDRGALPPPSAMPAEPEHPGANPDATADAGAGATADATARPAPRTPAEELIAGLAAELLGQPIGRDEDFFVAGGHSLLAAQLMARVDASFQLDLGPRAVFEAPTIAQLAAHVDEARRAGAGTAADAPALVPAPVPRDRPPLSFQQEQLWIVDRVTPDRASYNIPAAVRLDGELDAAALERALGQLAERHEILRTRLVVGDDGAPRQGIEPARPIPLAVEDLGDLPEDARLPAALARATDDARRPFDLAGFPLWRARLLRLAPRCHVLVLVLHHTVADGWSIPILVRELGALYRAARAGQPAHLPALPVQYADYALWQRAWLDGPRRALLLEHWRGALAGAPPLLALPTDRPRPREQRFSGARHHLELPGELVARLRRLAGREGVTLFMTLLSGYAVLLSRLSGQRDLVIGTPFAGRAPAAVEPLIGYFVNLLPLRVDLGGDPSVRELLRRVRRRALDAYAHAALPFELLVRDLAPERDLSAAPLVQVAFAYNQAAPDYRLDGVALELLELENDTAKFDLLLSLDEAGDRITGTLEYDRDLFDAATVARLAERLLVVLDELTGDTARPARALPVLRPDEAQGLLAAWNHVPPSWTRLALRAPEGACVHDLIERQAAATPDALAIACDRQALDYRALDQAANRVAHGLVTLELPEEGRVGLLLDRSCDFLVAMLGTFKAGGAYVPLEPHLPALRLTQMIEQTDCRILVTEARHRALAEQLAGGRPVRTVEDLGAGQPALRPARASRPRGLAYVMFTSGSTGTPKGVMIEHAGMLNHLLAKVSDLGLTGADVVAQTTTQGFDVSVWQFLAALLVGGGVTVLSDDEAWEAHRLFSALERHGVTIAETVPAHGKLLLEELDAAPGRYQLAALRWMILNAEALPVELCRAWTRHFPAVPLINTYGATECSDDTAHFRVPAHPPGTWRYVPISGSLPRLHAYVLDDQMQPALPGTVGEMFIGGAGVGRGYLGDPARTAERFVPDPFSAEPGARCYRTGDLVRHIDPGVIEFVGRADHQVKIHGHRVELGEIEAAVASHPEIRDSVVVVREAPGGPRLVAYVVWQPAAITTFEQLGAYLRQRLADFMVPARFVALDALPLSPNGKIDRNALPAPEEPRAEAHVAPRTPLEHTLAAIWSELLGAGPVSVTSNFFALGGHSMIAIQTVSRLRRATGHELTVRALFEHPTVAELAAHLESRSASATPAASAAVPVAGLVRQPPAERHELAVYQLPEWYMHALEPDSPFYNVSLDAVLTGELDVDAFVEAWRELCARHAVLRTTLASEGGRPAARIREHLPLERADVFVDRRATPAAEVPAEMTRLVEEWSNALFDFERGPLFRVRLAAFPERRFLFVFAAHHIVWDETSTMNMVGELAELYNARRAARPARLPALELEYTDFAAWINRALAAGELEAQRRYWLDKFATVPPALELPTDAPRPPRQRFAGDTVSVWLPADLTRRLDEVLRAEGLTLYIFLLAVLDLHLHRLSGQRDFVVGTPVANRDDVRLEPLLGLFATAVPLRATIAPGMTFRELLAQARATALEAYDHHNYPSILAIQEINPAIDPSRSRLFSVMYGVQNNKTRLLSELAFDGLTLAFADSHTRAEAQTARFDLTYVVDQLDDRIALQLNFDRDLFTRESAERMVDQFLRIVGEALEHPDRPIDRFTLVSPTERHRLVVELNKTAAVLGPDRAVHELCFEQAARSPGAVALVQGTTALTYADVAALAERWAARLVTLGVGPEDRVALWLDTSIEWIVAALAILRVGAAYVAIAPDHPPARSLAIVAQAGARLILTRGGVALPLLPDGVRVIAMDREWSDVATSPAPAPTALPAVLPDQLAYVAFTSGTTGEPKGIEITHRGVVNVVRSTDRDYRLGPADAALFLTSPGFDASVLDVFWPLATGARVVLPEVCGVRSDPRAIARLVRAHDISLFQCVPVMLQSIVEGRLGGTLPELPSLRLVISGGSALPRPLAERFARALPGCALGNHYGPTEVTVDATRRDALLPTRQALVPIGHPIANARVYVLDGSGEPVPAGVAGELYVASPGTARGYRGDPARTAAALVPDPFGPPGGRLYRTGDLGRIGEGGELEFLGRVDKQVKIRGHRVELTDLESCLHDHPAVRSCAVRVIETRTDGETGGETGGEALCAYVELTAEVTALDDLRMFTLAQRPELAPALEALHLSAWPAFFAGDASLRELWPRLPVEYPQHQFALVDAADTVLAAGNSIPLAWDGSLGDLPAGWTDGLRRALAAQGAGRRPDTLLILTGVAAQDAQGRGLSTILLRGFRALARALGLARVLVAVRPTGKAEHPEIDFAAWCTRRRDDGQLEDNWLRSHERVGARILSIAPRSQSVRGSVADWERWTGCSFPRSGEYDVPGALAKVRIDLAAGTGEYDEPAVWLQHADPARDDSAWAHVDPAALHEHVRARLPAYMVPDHLRIVGAMPLHDSGKIDERALPHPAAIRTARRRVPLTGPIQQQLGELWRAVLGCAELGASDDFFDLGGHSIRAAELISRINDAFGVEVPVRELYRVRTIAGLEPLVQAASISTPAVMSPPPAASLGRGTAHGHHGEILQGVFGSGGGDPRRALVTLPCSIFHSEASFEPSIDPSLEPSLEPGGQPGGAAGLTVDPDWRCKALRAAELALAWLGQRPDRGRLQVRSNIPVGWGLGSSTSDVIAAIRAVAAAFHRTIDPRVVAHLAVAAETASDATMFGDQAVLFAHRDGEVLESFGGPLPPLEVLGFTTDPGGIDTVRTRPAEYGWQEIEGFRPLLGLLRRAVEAKSPRLVAQVATASARISQRHLAKPVFAAIEELAAQVDALGIQVAHSGTVVGLLFDPARNNQQRIARAKEQLARLGLGPTWHFVTE